MLKLSLDGKVEAFRVEFRHWLQANPPPHIGDDSSLDFFEKTGRSWQAKLAQGKFLAVHWPQAFGGRGLSFVEEAVIQEELARVRSPQVLGLFGLTMVGPVLIKHGREEQKARFLPKILSAEEIWCQGFSEPGAGSDLAALKCKARPVADGYLLSGQKIWTSFAHLADWCFVLARTSEEASQRHEGLSYLLVDMKSKGIQTRPLTQISGDREFNEVFFDDVFVPAGNLVGAPGDGWKIAISTLMYERVILTFARQLQSEVLLRELVKKYGRNSSDEVKSRIAKELARACAVRALAYEHLLSYTGGASPGSEGSIDKLFWSESFQSIARLALDLQGCDAALGETGVGAGPEVHQYLYSRGRTIAAGTSEIQRNIIAERILGLPRLKFHQ